MKRTSRFTIVSVVVLLAMLLTGAFPHSALAQDGSPPPPDATEPAPTDPPPTEPAPTEVTPTEAAPSTSTEEVEPVALIESLPPETGLVVLDANGQPLPLTSTEAALVIATGDPMWCPAGSSPGDSDCTSSFADFNGVGGLLAELQTGPYSGAGTIYVAYNYTTAGEGGAIVIDGTLYDLTDLTIQGGWDFGLPNDVVGTTTFQEAVQIINWGYDVTLNDLIFDGPNGTESLLVEATGDIVLDDVEVKNNSGGDGAVLDNSNGTGTINVSDSSFHDNLTIGIQALSNNAISLSEVEAYDNGLSGAVLDNCDASPTCAATFAGTVSITNSEFNDNGGFGLSVESNGYIYGLDITASGNTLSGALLDNSPADAVHAVYMGYYDGNEFNNNGLNGLAVRSQGGVTLNDVTANTNGTSSTYDGAGVYIDNTYGAGDVVISNKNTYFGTYGEFNDNYSDGLDVISNGNVGLWYVRAEDNGTSGNAADQWGIGAYLDNCNWDGFQCDGTGWVTVTDSLFNSNYSAGLYVQSSDDIDLTDVTAHDNGNYGNTDADWAVGAYLDNCILDGTTCDGTGAVTISGGEFGNYVTGGNYGDGLQVYSSGDVYLEYVYAYDNGAGSVAGEGNGALLDACLENAGACAGEGSVYVFASEFNDNYSNGLSAFASDNIWLNYYVEAQGNGDALNVGFGTGALLVNNFTGATGSILLYGPITLNNNVENGLTADSNGDVYMTGVEANDNGGYGASVTTTMGSVTIDPSTFSSNDEYGVLVNATVGDVTANGIEASNNGTYGANIFSGDAVTIDLGTFDSNDTSFGLDILAAGDVNLTDVSADFNLTHGASIINGGDTSVTTSTFDSNTVAYGLTISSAGNVVLNDVSASDNFSYGASIANGGNTTITTGTFDWNAFDYGLDVSSSGDVSLQDVSASYNDTYGANISNGGNSSITSGFFDGNFLQFGLAISSTGNAALADVSASDNATYGANISNGGNTTIDDGIFDSNTADYGLHISSGGDVGLSDVSASDNATYGAFVGNSGNLTMARVYFDNNLAAYGLQTSSGGDVIITDISASDNATYGADISNGGFTSIHTGVFSGNLADYGLDIGSFSNVNLTDVTANSNATYGTYVSSGGDVNIDPSHFNMNGSYGLQVDAAGAISLHFVEADDNTTFGGQFANGAGPISIHSSSFSDNGGFGLDASGPGSITLVGATVNGNAGLGADLATAGGITIRDSYFNDNTGGVGLNAAANLGISLEESSAEDNAGSGAVITSGNNVFVRAGGFNGNAGSGLSIVSGGGTTLDAVGVDGNTLAGASVIAGGNVYVAPSFFTWNGANGLDITAGGTVLLAEVNASNNAGMGANVSAGGNITAKGGYFGSNTGDGLNLNSGGNIFTKCVTALSNGGYGIDASLPGTFESKGNTLEDNTAGDLNISGGGTLVESEAGCDGWPSWPTSGLPWQVFHVNNGDSHTLECTSHGGTVLILPNWDHVSIPCPVTGDASLSAVAADGLPGELGENYQYVSGMDVQVTPALDGEIAVDFLVPPGLLESNLIILHWDGSQWVDRGGTTMKDNFFEITSREDGVFVLVSQ